MSEFVRKETALGKWARNQSYRKCGQENYGWICPKCGLVNAPFALVCGANCHRKEDETKNSSSGSWVNSF